MSAFYVFYRSASLPVTFKVLEDDLKMNPKITRFVLPIGTINMDGSALYLTVALLFLAQINNVALGLGEIVTIGYDIVQVSIFHSHHNISDYTSFDILNFVFYSKYIRVGIYCFINGSIQQFR